MILCDLETRGLRGQNHLEDLHKILGLRSNDPNYRDNTGWEKHISRCKPRLMLFLSLSEI